MNVCKSVESQTLAQIWSQASASGKNMYLRNMLRDNELHTLPDTSK